MVSYSNSESTIVSTHPVGRVAFDFEPSTTQTNATIIAVADVVIRLPRPSGLNLIEEFAVSTDTSAAPDPRFLKWASGFDLATARLVAGLARLHLEEVELHRLTIEMESITQYLSQLARVDVAHVEATVHPVADRNLWRADAVQPSFKREEAAANAPESEQSFFKVPPVIE